MLRMPSSGMGQTNRRTMPVAGTAYNPWLFWDGRRDSQWSQALGPLESAVEHGTDRTQVAHVIAAAYAVRKRGSVVLTVAANPGEIRSNRVGATLAVGHADSTLARI